MRFALILLVGCSAPIAKIAVAPAEDPGVPIASDQLADAIHARWLGDPARAAKLLARASDIDGLVELGRAELALGHAKAADAAFARAMTKAEHGARGEWQWPALVTSRVAHLAFTPNGRWILVADTEGHVDIHDAGSLRVARSFDLSAGYPRTFEISPDGRWLASGVQSTQVWDLATLAMAGDFSENGTVAFTPDNRLLIAKSDGGFVEIDVATKKYAATIHGPKYSRLVATTAHVYAVDGPRVVTLDAKSYELQSTKSYPRDINDLRVTANGFVVATQDALVIGDTEIRGRYYTVAVAGSLVAATTNRQLRIFDGGKLVQTMSDPNVDTIAFHPRGELLVAAGWETASLWNARTGDHLAHVRRPAAGIPTLAFDARGDKLVAGAGSGHATIWSLATGATQTISIRPATTIDMLAFGPNGELATAAADYLAPGRTPSTLSLYAADGTRLWSRDLDRVSYIGYRPGTNQLTTVSTITKDDGSTTMAALLWRTDGTIEKVIDLVTSRGFHWNADGSAFAGSTNQELVTTTIDGQATKTTRFDLPHYSSALEPRTNRLAVSLDDGKVAIWDLATKRPTRVLFDTHGTMSAFAWTPDGKTLVTAAHDALALWDPDTGVRLAELTGPSAVQSLAIRPDGRVIAAGHADGRVTLWSVATGALIATLRSPGELSTFVTTPDGAVDGTAFDDALAWRAGTHVLPLRAAFARQRVPALLPSRLAQLPASTVAVRKSPVPPPPPPACYTDGEHNTAAVRMPSLENNTLHLCLDYSYYVRPRVSLHPPMMCFDVDLATGKYTPHAPSPLMALGLDDGPKLSTDHDGKVAQVCRDEACRSVDIRDDDDVILYPDADAKRLAAVYRIPEVARSAVFVYDVATNKRLSQFIAVGDGTDYQWLGETLMVTTTPCAGPCSSSVLFDVKTGREIAPVTVNTSALSAANLGKDVWAFNDWDSTRVVLQNVRTGRVVKNFKLPKQACTNEPDNELVSCDGITMLAAGSKLVILPAVRPGDVMVVDQSGKLLADHHLPRCQ